MPARANVGVASAAHEPAQAEIGIAEGPGDQHRLSRPGRIAGEIPLAGYAADEGDRDEEARGRAYDVAADHGAAELLAAVNQAAVDLLQRLDLGVAPEPQDDKGEGRGASPHGGEVRDVHRQGLVAQGVPGGVSGVEVNPLHHGVGGVGPQPARAVTDHGGVVADAPHQALALALQHGAEPRDDPELAGLLDPQEPSPFLHSHAGIPSRPRYSDMKRMAQKSPHMVQASSPST